MGKSFKLRNGLLLLTTEAPGGVYNPSQLKKLAALCEGDSAIAKVTEDQRLAIFAPPDRAAAIAKELRAVGLGVRHYQDGLHQPVNCIGELCGEHQQDAMGASMDVVRALAGLVLTSAPLKIGINGCGRCCVPTHTLDISVVGESQGYRISLGGRNAQLPELATYMAEGVPAAELPALLKNIVTIYKSLAQEGENLQALIERVGSRPFIEALAPYSQDGFAGDSIESLVEDEGVSPASNSESLREESFPEAVMADEFEAMEAAVVPEDHKPHRSEVKADPPAKAGKNPTPKAADKPVMPELDLDHDLLDGLPGFDPVEADGAVAAGPTIDGMELMGDDQGVAPMAVEPDLLDSDLPHEDPIPLLEDSLEVDPPSATLTEAEELSEFTDGPLAPVEEGFDAQEALSDDFDDELVGEHSQTAAENTFPSAVAVGEDIDPLDVPIEVESSRSAGMADTAPFTEKPTPGPSSDLDDDLSEELAAETVVDGAEADALEAKVTASIAEEVSAEPEEDENAEARQQAMNLITGEGIPNPEAVQDALEIPTDFSDLEIDADPIPFEDESPSPEFEAELEPGLVPEQPEEEDQAEPMPKVTGQNPRPSEKPSAPSPKAVSQARAPAGGFALSGVDLIEDGRISLGFASGVNLVVDPRTIGPGVTKGFNFGGQRINITALEQGLNVEVDGVTIFLPAAA